MIVLADDAPLARALASELAGEPGSNMWAIALSPTGQLPTTHYISTGLIQQEFAAMMADANAIYAACQQIGSATTLADIQALLASSDITGADSFVRLTELGLQMVQDPLP